MCLLLFKLPEENVPLVSNGSHLTVDELDERWPQLAIDEAPISGGQFFLDCFPSALAATEKSLLSGFPVRRKIEK